METLLEKYLEADYSPWNYPVYVIAQESGFVSIEGETNDGRPLTAVGVFTTKEKADTYLKATGEEGSLCKLENMQQARKFLSGMSINVFSVALDLVAFADKRVASHCFDIETLLEKYLVKES